MARKASRQFKDRPISPLDEAVYWVERTLRHDTNFLKIYAIELTWYMLLDVALIATLIMVLAVWLIYKLFSLLHYKQKSITKKDGVSRKNTHTKKSTCTNKTTE